MGFLSQNAEKAFNKASKRAYVPPWWRPASYLAGGVAVTLVLVIGFTSRGDDTPQYATAAELEGGGQVNAQALEIVINPNAGASSSPRPSSGNATSAPTGPPSASSAAPAPQGTPAAGEPAVQQKNQLPATSGGTISVEPQALNLARKAAVALYTGRFEGVPIYDSMQPPSVTNKWPNATLAGLQSAEDLGGQGYIIQAVVDPDAETGPEAQRTVQVVIVKVGADWYFQPY